MRDKLIAAFADEALHECLRVRAFEERCSMSEVVRRALTKYLGKRKQRKGRSDERPCRPAAATGKGVWA